MAIIIPTDYQTMLSGSYVNVYGLFEAGENLRTRLEQWRDTFFPLLDLDQPEEAKIHSWVVPTDQLSKSLSNSLLWFDVERVACLLQSTIAALAYNGYLNPALEAPTVIQFKNAWA